MSFVCLNGEFLSADQPYLSGDNRSFKFGDGLFESIRIVNGKPFNLDSHSKRIQEGLKVLRIQMPLALQQEKLEALISELLVKNGIDKGGKVRLTIFRSGEGTYMPLSMSGGYLLEASPLDDNLFTLNESGLSVDVYDDIKKPVNSLAPFKTSNGLLYIMTSVNAREQGLDDVLLMNDQHNIIEGSSSNIFIVSNGVLYTPTIADGCVGGTFRMKLINVAIDNNIKVYECSLTPQNLLAAEEIFFTNSIKGIQWIGSYKTKRYYCEIARKLVGLVNQSLLEADSSSSPDYQGT